MSEILAVICSYKQNVGHKTINIPPPPPMCVDPSFNNIYLKGTNPLETSVVQEGLSQRCERDQNRNLRQDFVTKCG